MSELERAGIEERKKREEKQYRQERISSLSRHGINLIENSNQKKDGPFSYLFDIAGLYSTMRMENIQTELMEISDLLGGVGKGIRDYNWG